MVNLDIQTKQQVRGAGYGIQFVGLDSHQMKLYLHKDQLSDKHLGDVFMKVNIANPKTGPNSPELQYLARKGNIGLFAWEPGDACLVKKFEKVEYIADLIGGGTRVVRQTPDMGCQWCRARAEDDTNRQSAGVVDSSETEPVMEEVSTPSAALQCDQCEYVPKAKNKRGKPFSRKQSAAQMKAHISSAHH
jgi:hypothetical protein|tara:strand:+ start:112 stop:681 length:570 start_codon:yes stop_codon:yes gene_type:complete